jgi:hypothetical protein
MQNFIYVSKQDIYFFQKTSRRRNSIRMFWKDILKHMQIKLKKELKKKPTILAEMYGQQNIYKFVTRDASEQLRSFLEQYTVLLIEKDDSENFVVHDGFSKYLLGLKFHN